MIYWELNQKKSYKLKIKVWIFDKHRSNSPSKSSIRKESKYNNHISFDEVSSKGSDINDDREVNSTKFGDSNGLNKEVIGRDENTTTSVSKLDKTAKDNIRKDSGSNGAVVSPHKANKNGFNPDLRSSTIDFVNKQ